MTKKNSIKNLQKEIEVFVTQRDWQQFHSPKNLVMALMVESAELQEIFLWLTQQQSFCPDDDQRIQIEEEIGDVMIYLTTLAAQFGIDPIEAALEKMVKNRDKYPAEKVRGKATKYDKY